MRRLLALLAILPLLAAGCTKGPTAAEREAAKPKKLVYWRVIDGQDAFEETFRAYRRLHPNVSFDYRTFRLEDYEKELLNAFAEDRGPDIFSIHNTWITSYGPKIAPLPETLVVPFTTVSGGLEKKQVTTLKKIPGLTLRKLQNEFVDQVVADVFRENKIYGLPLALDTLALFSNKNLLNAAGIAEPPKTWDEVQEAVKKLTTLDRDGNVLQSGISLGTARNVDRATDILSLIMMQIGAQMADESGRPTFNLLPPELSGAPALPGITATTFYTDFANPDKEVYSWNERFPSSAEAFATGRTAMMLGYSYHIPLIRGRAPKLKFTVSGMPQATGGAPVHFANYWVETVSKKTEHPDIAWDFIQFATGAEQAPQYLAAAKRPTARKALRGAQLEDLDLGVFADQILTARSWYRGADAAAADAALKELIDAIRAGAGKPVDALNLAASKVNQTF